MLSKEVMTVQIKTYSSVWLVWVLCLTEFFMEHDVRSGAVIVSFHKHRKGFCNRIECQILSTTIKSGPLSINCNHVCVWGVPLSLNSYVCVRGVGGNKSLEWHS